MLGAGEQGEGPLLGERLGDVDELAAAVIALARQPFGVLVRQPAALGFHHGGRRCSSRWRSARSCRAGGGARPPSPPRARDRGRRSAHRRCRALGDASIAASSARSRSSPAASSPTTRATVRGRSGPLDPNPRWPGSARLGDRPRPGRRRSRRIGGVVDGAVDDGRGRPAVRRPAVDDAVDGIAELLDDLGGVARRRQAGQLADVTGSGPTAAASARGAGVVGMRSPIVGAPPVSSGGRLAPGQLVDDDRQAARPERLRQGGGRRRPGAHRSRLLGRRRGAA